MKRSIARVLLGLGGALVLLVAATVATAAARWDRTFDVPEPEIAVSYDSASVARGRYLAFGPAHCAYCHATMDLWPRIDAGEDVPLAGGEPFRIPPGTFYPANITPDPETGIGRMSDGQLARALRHGVRADGRATLPVMEFHDLSDEDLASVIAFLRTQPAVRNSVPEHRMNLLGKAIMAFVIRPRPPSATPPARSPAEAPTVERGEYLANAVANCAGCHSPRNMMDGSYTGPRFSGGLLMPLDDDPSVLLAPPNLTPDPKTGHIAGWSEERFLARFRAGRLIEGSHMPWPLYGRMSDDDLKAIRLYLMSLEPVENDTGPLVQRKGRAGEAVAGGE